MGYKKYRQKTICKNFIEAVLSIHESIWKSQKLGANKQVSFSTICKYNLLRKADTLLGIPYRIAKVNRTFWVEELRYRKCILYKKIKCISYIRKKSAKHDGFCSPYKDQISRLRILENWFGNVYLGILLNILLFLFTISFNFLSSFTKLAIVFSSIFDAWFLHNSL